MELILAATEPTDATWFDWAQVLAAVFAATAAVGIPLTAFWRRPSLLLSEREAKRHRQVESDAPYLRLLVENKARRRVARGTLAWAVASVGVSLAFAAFARLPLPIRVNRYSDESLASHIGAVVKACFTSRLSSSCPA